MSKAIVLPALHFIELDYIDHPTMSGWRFEPPCEIWVFLLKPLSDRLVCVASTKSANDLTIVAISSNGFQYCPLPGTLFPQIFVICVQGIGIISYLTVVGLEVGIILAQVLDLLYEVVLMCFGMWFVDASQLACSTSTANVRSGPITL